MGVLIAGAGPTGLALACGVRMHGVDVRIVDAAAGPAPTSRANILHARGVEVLDRLRAMGDIRERAVQAMHFTTYARGRVVSNVRFGDSGLGTTVGSLNVSQAVVERALRNRLEELGGTVEWDTTLTTAEQDPKGVTAMLSDGSVVRADHLVGCDGAHSATRKLAGIGFPGEPVADRWLIADVHATWDGATRSGTSVWLHPRGSVFAVPMRPDIWRVMIYQRGERSRELDEAAVLERIRRLMPERSGVSGLRIDDALWTSDFQIHRRLASTYRSGRILLAGDAAHIHSPLGGQGMLTGLGDAENLAWKLALVVEGRARQELLDTYEAERRPLAEKVLRGTSRATRLETRDGALSRFVLEHVVGRLTRLPAVQRWSTWQASQLWTTYRKGPLGARTGRTGRPPWPGDRMPDLPCLRTDGTETRLHAELGGRWALLGPESLVATARGFLGDFVVRLRCPDPAGDALLVRPDGHLAWRGSDGSASLEPWLRRALGA